MSSPPTNLLSLLQDFTQKLFEIQEFFPINIEKNTETKTITIDLIPKKKLCPKYNREVPGFDHSYRRIFIGNLLGNSIWAHVLVYRIQCPQHGVLTQKMEFVEGKKHYSKAVENYMPELTNQTTVKGASHILGLPYYTTFRIDYDSLNKLLKPYTHNIPSAQFLSGDEKSYKRRHNYITILSDLEIM